MKLVSINNRMVSVAEILSGSVSGTTSFETSLISFIREWQSGVQEFKLFTSGSTGAPKEIKLTREQLKQSARRTISALGLQERVPAFVCLDTKNIAGKMMVVRAIEANMEIVAVEPSSNPFQTLSLDFIGGFTALVPLQFQEIIKHPASLQKLNTMKNVIIGGAAVNSLLRKESANLKCAVYATYGMTETVSHIALQRLNGPQASDYFTTLVGIKINTDKRGCLVIQVPEFPEPIVTNDIVELISANQFRWLGRYDNVINSGGFKISPEKIEREVERLLPDQAFFVTSILDERLGEKLVLIVEGSQPNIDISALQLHPYEIPKDVILLPEFTRTETGKINRSKTKLLAIGH